MDIGMKAKIRLIADHYGTQTQLLKLAEECSEYSAAVQKWQVYRHLESRSMEKRQYFEELKGKAIEGVRKELADVLILARQVQYLIENDPELASEVKRLMNEKCNRQLNRIDAEIKGERYDGLS